jgi:hypothetical protein
MLKPSQAESQLEVAAIITAMTDAEQPFVRATMESVLSDPGIAQVILCVEIKNTWIYDTLGAVRNFALVHVRMPWVAYCDGDDVWCQGKTLTQLSYAKKMGCDFVGTDHYLTNENGQIRACALARYLPMPSSWMVRTEIMKQHPFDESPFSLIKDESGEWWGRTAGIVSKGRCSKLLLRYRIRNSSLSTKTQSMQRKAKVVALSNNPGFRPIILLATWITWLFTRQDKYIWYKGWGQPPLTSQDK